MVYLLSSKNVRPYVKAERVYAEMGPKKFYVYIPIGIAVDCMSIILLVLAWVVCPSILLDEGENLTNFIIGK